MTIERASGQIVGLLVTIALGATAITPATGMTGEAGPFSHAAFDTVLARHLEAGRFDYGGLHENPAVLNRYVAALAEADPSQWPRDEQVAFWVNAYNARVIAGVLDHPGLESVLHVGRIAGIPTLAFFRRKARTGGELLSLNDIEHGILRKRFADARLHFVLNCASTSCPDLPPHAVSAATLDSVLARATADFLANHMRNRISLPDTLLVSEIFKWYREDFVKEAGSVPAFIRAHHPDRPALPDDAKVQYMKYDWNLNGHW